MLGFPVGTVKPTKKEVQTRFRDALRSVHPDHGGDESTASRSIDELGEKHSELRPEVLELLQTFKTANVILDGPGFPPTRSLTARHAYLRFHGRNYDLWYSADEKEDDYRINRYDYLYTEDQLRK